MKESVTILKLTNGENIIGKVVKSENTIDISLPLKFMIMPRMTETGFAESLSLSPWIHPLTDEEYITINSNHVIMSTLASSALTSYYIHCVDQFNIAKKDAFLYESELELEPTNEELEEIEEEELEEFIRNIKPDKTIH
jgi:hypothetical protein